jgi:hypothetical protein
MGKKKPAHHAGHTGQAGDDLLCHVRVDERMGHARKAVLRVLRVFRGQGFGRVKVRG